MAIMSDLTESAARLEAQSDRLMELLRNSGIRSLPALTKALRTDARFKAEWHSIWSDVARADGGKISLATAGTVLGTVLGGVGIAAMGGAIGLPLALVLGLGGLIAGTEVDSLRAASRTKIHLLRLPKSLHDRLQASAKEVGVTPNDLIATALAAAFPDKAG